VSGSVTVLAKQEHAPSPLQVDWRVVSQPAEADWAIFNRPYGTPHCARFFPFRNSSRADFGDGKAGAGTAAIVQIPEVHRIQAAEPVPGFPFQRNLKITLDALLAFFNSAF